MKPTEFLPEFDQKDSGEYNDEAGMALSNLETICRSARELEKHIGSEENLPEWCQEKLAVVKGMLVAVTDYMVSQDSLDAKQDDFAFNTDRIAEHLSSMLESGVAEGSEETPFGSVTDTSTHKPYVAPSRQDIWDKNDLVNRQAEAREQKQLTLRYARKHGRQAMEDIWAKKTDVRMTVEEILEFLDATVNDPGLTPEEFMGTRGLDETGHAQPKTDEKLRQYYADLKAKKQNMDQYRKDTANMAKDAIVNKMPLSKNQVNEFAGGMGASSVATAPGVGKGPKVGSLFGGSYAPKTPFKKKRKQ